MIYRVYPTKSNTLSSSNIYGNAGLNPVFTLQYGGGISSNSGITRCLLYFDLTELQSKFASMELNQSLISNVTINLKNAAFGIPDFAASTTLQGGYFVSVGPATSFDLICAPVDRFWDSGSGYDIKKNYYNAIANGQIFLTGYSNWVSSTTVSAWSAPGVYSNITGDTSYYATQHFNFGSEDICMSIMPMFNGWLSGANNGCIIAFSDQYESIISNSSYAVSFLNNNTLSTFLQYLEIDIDQEFVDNRHGVYLNQKNKLFFYGFSGHSFASYMSASSVVIQTQTGQPLLTLSPTQQENGIYFVEIPHEIMKNKFKDIIMELEK